MHRPDSIHISNLMLDVRIGVTDEEQMQPQRLTVSLTLQPLGALTDLQDRIERTINYAEVCVAIRELAEARPRRLIETLAEDIAIAVLTGFEQCASVEVELRKFILWETDYVSVRLTRQRSSGS